MKRQRTRMRARTAVSVARRQRSRRDPVATFRNSRGETLEPASVTASEAKSGFGRVLDMTLQTGAVLITKHDVPKAVILSVENFNALTRAREMTLDTLSREFDALLAKLQTPQARSAMRSAFAASPRQLGKAAVASARTRG
jgi:antitoxin Phd